MSSRDLPPLPWSLWRVPMAPLSGRTDLWVVRDADQHIVLETEHEDVARAIASDPIQALLLAASPFAKEQSSDNP